MDDKQTARRVCQACGSERYLFRGRKKILAREGQQQAMETKYRCKECGHAWKEQVPVKEVT